MNAPIKYGLLTGVGLSLWQFGEFSLGWHTLRPGLGEYGGYCSALIPALLFYGLLRRQRDTAATGRLEWGPALQAGLSASFAAAAVVYCFLLIYNQVINPGWIDTALDWKVAQWRAHGEPETTIRIAITAFRARHSPPGLVAPVLVGLTLLGGLITAALTWFLRRAPQPPPPSH